MKTKVVRIGNSQGIRIPKTLLAQCGLSGAVELDVRDGQLVLHSATRSRAGWDEAFRRMHVHRDDALLDRDARAASAWDRTEWRW
jgi:antitoxin MazE